LEKGKKILMEVCPATARARATIEMAALELGVPKGGKGVHPQAEEHFHRKGERKECVVSNLL